MLKQRKKEQIEKLKVKVKPIGYKEVIVGHTNSTPISLPIYPQQFGVPFSWIDFDLVPFDVTLGVSATLPPETNCYVVEDEQSNAAVFAIPLEGEPVEQSRPKESEKKEAKTSQSKPGTLESVLAKFLEAVSIPIRDQRPL